MAIMPPIGFELVDPPKRTPMQGGIFDVLPQERPLVLDGHQLRGITYRIDATGAVAVIDESAATINGTASKGGDFGDIEYIEGTPFTVYVSRTSDRILRSEDDIAADAEAHLIAASQRGVETALWTKQLPEGDGLDLNPAGAVSAKDAVGILGEYVGSNYVYTPTLHFGRRLAPYLADNFLVKFDDGKAAAIGGTLAAHGAGYVGQVGPDGTEAADNERWLWATGQIQIWEGAAQTHGGFDHNTNKIFAFSERTYIVTTDGLEAAIRVKLS